MLAVLLIAGCSGKPVTPENATALNQTSAASEALAHPDRPAHLTLVNASLVDSNGKQVYGLLVAHPKDQLTLAYRVLNDGSEDGQFYIQLTANGIIFATHSLRIIAGGIETGELPFVARTTGTFSLFLQSSVGDASGTADATSTALQVKVVLPPNLAVTATQPSKNDAAIGEIVDFTSTVTNTGEEEGTKDIKFEVNSAGNVPQVQKVTIAPGARSTITFSWACPASGAFSIRIDDTPAGTINCFSRATFSVFDLGATSYAPQPLDQVNVSLSLQNTGDQSGSVTWEVRLGFTSLGSEQIKIGARSGAVIIDHIRSATITSGVPQDLTVLLEGKVTATKRISPLLPGIALYAITNSIDSHWYTSRTDCAVGFRIANNGTGAEPGAIVTVLLNGHALTSYSLAEYRNGAFSQYVHPGNALPTIGQHVDRYYQAAFSGCTYQDKFEIRIDSPFSGEHSSGEMRFGT